MKQIYFLTSDQGVWHGFFHGRGPLPFKRIMEKAKSLEQLFGGHVRIILSDPLNRQRDQDITEWVHNKVGN